MTKIPVGITATLQESQTPCMRIGGNNNYLQLKEGKIYYHKHDITDSFINLIISGYFDKFILKEDVLTASCKTIDKQKIVSYLKNEIDNLKNILKDIEIGKLDSE